MKIINLQTEPDQFEDIQICYDYESITKAKKLSLCKFKDVVSSKFY